MEKKTIAELNLFAKNTLIDNLGIKFTDFKDEKLYAEMEVQQIALQPFGFLHGGTSLAISETLGSFLSYIVTDTDTYFVFGSELNGYHVKTARKGEKLTAVASFISKGNSTHVSKIEIFNSNNDLVHYSTMINRVVRIDEFQKRNG